VLNQNRKGRRFARFSAFIGLSAWVLSAANAHAQEGLRLTSIEDQPKDCASLLDPLKATGRVLDWKDTVALEHCDRIKRLWRLTFATAGMPGPTFFETRVPGQALSPRIPVDIPLLRVVFPNRVFFDTGSWDLRPDAQEVIRTVAQSLRSDVSDVAVFIVGHTDWRGDRDYNQDLSIRRADAVARAIVHAGTGIARVWRMGFGKDFPLVVNDSSEHMALNRRVEFLFAARQEAAMDYLAHLRDQVCRDSPARERSNCIQIAKVDLDDRPYRAVQLEMKPVAERPVETASADLEKISMEPMSTREVVITPAYRRVDPVTPIYHGPEPSTPP